MSISINLSASIDVAAVLAVWAWVICSLLEKLDRTNNHSCYAACFYSISNRYPWKNICHRGTIASTAQGDGTAVRSSLTCLTTYMPTPCPTTTVQAEDQAVLHHHHHYHHHTQGRGECGLRERCGWGWGVGVGGGGQVNWMLHPMLGERNTGKAQVSTSMPKLGAPSQPEKLQAPVLQQAPSFTTVPIQQAQKSGPGLYQQVREMGAGHLLDMHKPLEG